MPDINILDGNLDTLAKIESDLRAYVDKKNALQEIADESSKSASELSSLKKRIESEKDEKIEEGLSSVCSGFDKSLALEEERKKEIKAKRSQAKNAGVVERIELETADLVKANADMKSQINQMFAAEKIPKYCNSWLFHALIQTSGFKDVFGYICTLLIAFLAIPYALFYFKLDTRIIIIYNFVLVTVIMSFLKYVFYRTVVNHHDTIERARILSDRIAANKHEVKKKTKLIKRDSDETMYGLEGYDKAINDTMEKIKSINEQSKAAVKNFEEVTKPQLIAEIDGRFEDELKALEEKTRELASKEKELGDDVAKEKIYIASHYEAYIGKGYLKADKLAEIRDIMNRHAGMTIGQAIAVLKANS